MWALGGVKSLPSSPTVSETVQEDKTAQVNLALRYQQGAIACLRGGLASCSRHNDSGSGSHGGCGDECAREVVRCCWNGREEKLQDKDKGNEQRDIMPMFVLDCAHERGISRPSRTLEYYES